MTQGTWCGPGPVQVCGIHPIGWRKAAKDFLALLTLAPLVLLKVNLDHDHDHDPNSNPLTLVFCTQPPDATLYSHAAPLHNMDSSYFDQADLDRLSPGDKQQLRQFINNEQQKAQIQQRTFCLDTVVFPTFHRMAG